jgi:hypothetical protein
LPRLTEVSRSATGYTRIYVTATSTASHSGVNTTLRDHTNDYDKKGMLSNIFSVIESLRPNEANKDFKVDNP